MSRDLKLILILITGLTGSQIFGMQAVRAHWKKCAVAATVALPCVVHELSEKDFDEKVKILPNMGWQDQHTIRQNLVASVPSEVDKEKLKKIQLKPLPGVIEPMARNVDGEWIILFGDSVRPGKRWSDFAYLHQVARLHYKDLESKKLRNDLGWSSLNAGAAYYFLKNPTLKRSVATVPLYLAGRLGLTAMDHWANYRAEARADEFAIQALKSREDAKALEEGALELIGMSKLDRERERALYHTEEDHSQFVLAAAFGERSKSKRSFRLTEAVEELTFGEIAFPEEWEALAETGGDDHNEERE